MPSPEKETRSVCPYCGVGCGVLIRTQGAEVLGVAGDPEHPTNRGRLCSKGAALVATTGLGTRALKPELRLSKDLMRAPVSWDTALSHIAEKFAATIDEHGPHAVAFYISGQLLTEDYYVFNKLAKGLIGTNNLDTNSRLCMSSAVTGYKATLGADAPPACYDDIELAEVILIAGANPAYAHPILYRRIEDARRVNPALKVIVVDPRRTATAADADLHLAVMPGSDVALFNGLLHLLVWENQLDAPFIANHTEGFAELKAAVLDFTPREVARICGISEDDLRAAARLIGGARGFLSLYCQGLNQSTQGTANNATLINLHLATGQIGRPGAGPLSLTGQPNAMGGREVGGMATLLSAHRELSNATHRAEVATLWGIPAVPEKPGKTALEMFEAMAGGEIKCVWIACTNPAQSLPDQALVRDALTRAELVVVQDAFVNTETMVYADVLLPATTWPEKDGTMTNSERRIARVRAARAAPGETRADWQIVVDFARRLAARRPALPAHLFGYDAPAQIFDEHRASTAGRDLDITGLSYAQLEQMPQQWPCATSSSPNVARLYTDGRFATPSGRARFYVAKLNAAPEPADAKYPFVLNTGRLRDQWHGMSRSGQVAKLFEHAPEPMVDMHPSDMARRGIPAGALVRVRSRRGEVLLRAQPQEGLRVGQVFIPMHWGSQWWSGAGINALTLSARDPISHQPALKAATVAVERVEFCWELVAAVTNADATLLSELRDELRRFDYASLGCFGRAREGCVLRLAHPHEPDADLLARLLMRFGVPCDGQTVSYVDTRAGIARYVRLDDGKMVAFVVSGNRLGHDWLMDFIASGREIETMAARLVVPSARPPGAFNMPSPVICTCKNVTARAIETRLATLGSHADAFSVLQRELGCASECGSCGPEVRRLIARGAPVPAVA